MLGKFKLFFIFTFFILIGFFCASLIDTDKTILNVNPQAQKLQVGNLTREYFVHEPEFLPDGSAVVIILHGGGGPLGSAELMMKKSGWSEKAEKEKFLAVFPQGTIRDNSKPLNLDSSNNDRNIRTWSDFSGVTDASLRGVDDIGFISRLIDEVQKKYSIDKKRVYVTGFSNGATMSYALGIELSEKIAAIAPVAGLLYVKKSLASPVSLVSIVGKEDKPPQQKKAGFIAQIYAENSYIVNPVGVWRDYLSCESKLGNVKNNSDQIILEYGPCLKNTNVASHILKGIGHVFPGRASLFEEGVGVKDNVSAVDIAWSFFLKYPKVD